MFVLDAAVRTFVLPRGTPVLLTWFVFRTVRRVFGWFARPAKTYEQRDRVMALYAPVALLALPTVSLVLVFAGFTFAFFGLDHDGWRDAIDDERIVPAHPRLRTPADDSRRAPRRSSRRRIGLGLLALVIAYLPTIYGAFSRREVAVTDLSVRAGTPPKPWEMLERAHLAGYLNELDAVWATWMVWFTELSETHTSLASLSFFRSPNPHRSWIIAAGAVLDSAALRLAILDMPFTPGAGAVHPLRATSRCGRSPGCTDTMYDPDPKPDDADLHHA